MSGTNADLREFMLALKGLEFPVSRDGALKRAQDTGGIDTEVLYILERLPDRTYESADELKSAIRQTYESFGGLEGNGPAATASNDARRAASVKADTRNQTD